MKNIQKVVVGSRVTELEDGLFRGLTGLKDVDFTNCKFGIRIPVSCFSNCENLQQFTYPGANSECDDYVFFKCRSLSSISFLNSVTSIGLSACYDCNSLESLTNTGSVTAIADGAFQNCSKLDNISLASVKTIGNNAFRSCKKLASVDRFNGRSTATAFETVGEYAFADTNLKTAKLTLRSSADRTWWGEYCFASCDNLETVEFLSSCYLGSHMFDHCTKLKNIKFDIGAISYVGKYVFKDCTSLQSVTFPKQQFSFLQGFFEGCTSLKEVKFNEYGEGSQFCYVQKNAFNKCNQLTSVEFPVSLNSVSKIEDAALSGCALTKIKFHGISKDDISDGSGKITDEKILTTGLFRLNKNCTIITKDGSQLKYTYRSGETKPYNPPYEYSANLTAVSDFKTPFDLCNRYPTMKAAHQAGQNPWYYNVKEVVEYAKHQNIPVLCFYSYETCTPCQAFKANIYEADDFQDWIKKQKFLVCRIEADKPKAYDTELLYCEDVLSRDALNYCKDGASQPREYNGFGDYAGKGYFRDVGANNKNLTPPVMIFYYKDSSGNQVAYHDYSLHSLNDYFNAENIGIEGVKKMIKRLCLYHFDNNNPNNSKYVAEVDEPFDRKDYVLENPYKVGENTITLSRWEKMKGKELTVANVKSEMKKLMEMLDVPGGGKYQYPEYIGGCLFGDFDWITLSFSDEDNATLLESKDAKTKNNILSKIDIVIGNHKYKFKLNESDYRSQIPTPCGDDTVNRYDFVKI